jgi:hypothetical protein
LIVDAELKLPEARQCVAQLIEIGQSVRMWLLQNKGFDKVMADLRALNPLFMVFAPKIQAGFTTRLKSEQATMRRLVIRMDAMRRTSYVSAAYLIAEITAMVIFPGAADANLDVLEHSEERLRGLLTTMGASA